MAKRKLMTLEEFEQKLLEEKLRRPLILRLVDEIKTTLSNLAFIARKTISTLLVKSAFGFSEYPTILAASKESAKHFYMDTDFLLADFMLPIFREFLKGAKASGERTPPPNFDSYDEWIAAIEDVIVMLESMIDGWPMHDEAAKRGIEKLGDVMLTLGLWR